SDDAADGHDGDGGGGGLEDTADGKDDAAKNDGDTAADEVGEITSDNSAKESSGRENRSSKRLLPGRELEGGVVGSELRAGSIAGEQDMGVLFVSVELYEVRHGEHAGHPSGVISEEDAAEGGEGA
ncbi:hypothetical protein V495_08370, partial [Pseudogymnoascus sp. VKM F-4514 (FW-929)]